MVRATFDPIEDGDNAGEAFEKINRALARTDLTSTTHILTKNRFGRWKTITLAEATTFQITMEVESHFSTCRVAIPNLSAAPVNGVKAAVAMFEEWINPHYYSHPYPATSWEAVSWDGAASVNLPARHEPELPSVTYSDIVTRTTLLRKDNPLKRPIVSIRLQYPAGSVVTVPYNDFYGWRTEEVAAAMRVTKQAILGVDVPLNYTNTQSVDANCPIPIFQYSSKRAGLQIMGVGDSTTEGVGPNTRCFGPVARVCNTLSSLAAPCEFYNAGMHAQGQRTYVKQATYNLNKVMPTHLVYQPYSINDTPNGGMDGNTRGAIALGTGTILELVRRSTIPTHLLFLEGLPCNPPFRDTGAGDQLRRDFNASLPVEYSGLTVVEGYAEAITGERDEDGQDWIAGGLTGDNVHPNEAGSDVLAAVLLPYIVNL